VVAASVAARTERKQASIFAASFSALMMTDSAGWGAGATGLAMDAAR
jgi:hypothetical protein